MAKKARTVARELKIPVERVLELAGHPGKSEHTLVEPEAVEAAAKAAATSQNGSASAGQLLTLPRRRGKDQRDDDILQWCREVVDADRSLREGPTFRPRFTQSGRTMVEYPDPLDEFLEPRERNARDGNLIKIGLEELNLYLSNPKRHFRWRSNELLKKFERKLSQLWLANPNCRFCYGELTQGFRSEVKQLLVGHLYLPETAGVPRKKVLKFPQAHEWCVDIRERIRDLMVEMQDKQGDDEESIALRAGMYQNFMESIHAKYSDDGIDYSTIVDAFRANLRVIRGTETRKES